VCRRGSDRFFVAAVAPAVQVPESKRGDLACRKIFKTAGGHDGRFQRQLRREAGDDLVLARRRAGFIVDDDGAAILCTVDTVGFRG
jgi:hypothetical protein